MLFSQVSIAKRPEVLTRCRGSERGSHLQFLDMKACSHSLVVLERKRLRLRVSVLLLDISRRSSEVSAQLLQKYQFLVCPRSSSNRSAHRPTRQRSHSFSLCP